MNNLYNEAVDTETQCGVTDTLITTCKCGNRVPNYNSDLRQCFGSFARHNDIAGNAETPLHFLILEIRGT
jgi:hypothetical protein